MTRVVLQLRMSEAEKSRLREAAESAGKTMSEYVMSCCFPDQPLKGIVHASVDEVLSCGTLKLGAASKNATMAFGLAESADHPGTWVPPKERCAKCRREERVKGRLPEKCEVCDG